MAVASLKDLFLADLHVLYAAETQMSGALRRFAEASRTPELRDALEAGARDARLHLERLKLILSAWNEPIRAAASPAAAGLVREADERIGETVTPDARDAAVIGVAQRLEHYLIAVYGCARAYAERLGRSDQARLLQETLDEEGRADHLLTQLAEAHINDDARMESDLAPMPAERRLRYIDRGHLDTTRLGDGALSIRDAQDHEIGSFDGLVVTPANHPCYLVVKRGGLWPPRRTLLPIDQVSFDAEARVLRTEVPEDLAARYPEFERDRFEPLDPSASVRSSVNLIEALGRACRGDKERPTAHVIPEWLMTGVWITVPPEKAAALPDEARSFANEFAPNRVQEGAWRGGEGGAEAPGSCAGPPEVSATPPHGDRLRRRISS